MKIIYEPHPINPARKAKLQAKGYKIIDAIFAPPGTPLHEELDVEVEEENAPAPEPVVADEVQEVVEEVEAAAEPVEVEVEADEVSGDEEVSKRGRPRKE
jgi:hypothetical protein